MRRNRPLEQVIYSGTVSGFCWPFFDFKVGLLTHETERLRETHRIQLEACKYTTSIKNLLDFHLCIFFDKYSFYREGVRYFLGKQLAIIKTNINIYHFEDTSFLFQNMKKAVKSVQKNVSNS